MPEKKIKDTKKSDDLMPFATIFEAPELNLSSFISESTMVKLKEKIGAKIELSSLFFTIGDKKEVVVLMCNPTEKKKSVILSSKKATAQKFYDAVKVITKEQSK